MFNFVVSNKMFTIWRKYKMFKIIYRKKIDYLDLSNFVIFGKPIRILLISIKVMLFLFVRP